MTDARQLAGFPLMAVLSDEQRAAVAEVSSNVTFAAGRRLFEEGHPARKCWLIRSGEIGLDTEFPGAGRRTIQTLGPGDVVGWSWLVPPYEWHFGAVARTDVEAVELDAPALRALAEGDPSLGYPLLLGMFEALLSRLQSTRARVLDLYGSPRER